jgi:hypothetical protein
VLFHTAKGVPRYSSCLWPPMLSTDPRRFKALTILQTTSTRDNRGELIKGSSMVSGDSQDTAETLTNRCYPDEGNGCQRMLRLLSLLRASVRSNALT